MRRELVLVSEQSFYALQTIKSTAAKQNASSKRVKDLSNRVNQSRPPQAKK